MESGNYQKRLEHATWLYIFLVAIPGAILIAIGMGEWLSGVLCFAILLGLYLMGLLLVMGFIDYAKKNESNKSTS